MRPDTVVPRLIATDLDGTLLGRDGCVSPRTQRALQSARAAGIQIVMVTGRPPRHVSKIVGVEGFGALVICVNGALTYDLERQSIVYEERLPAYAAQALIERLRTHLPGICFAVEVGLDFGWEPAYGEQRKRNEVPQLAIADALTLVENGVNKLIARHPELLPPQLLERSREVIGARATLSFSGAPFLEIGAPEVSKASALARYCEDRAIDSAEVISFGDMPNDLPMLEWAGYSVAMANAHPSVLSAADEVTSSNEEDGVASVIERFFCADEATSC